MKKKKFKESKELREFREYLEWYVIHHIVAQTLVDNMAIDKKGNLCIRDIT